MMVNNAIISPSANPMMVPAATPRVSIFCSVLVISTSSTKAPYGKSWRVPPFGAAEARLRIPENGLRVR